MSIKGANILVTGGAGFIGSRLCERLVSLGANVTVFDCLLEQVHGANQANIERLSGLGITPVVGDVRDQTALRQVMSETNPSIIYHLAAETGTGQSFDEPARYTGVNVQGTSELVEAIRAQGGVRRVILAGSRAVYGEGACRDPRGHLTTALPRSDAALAAGDYAPKNGAGESLVPVPSAASECAVQPASIYASSKLMQEYILQQALWGSEIEVGILRLQNVYGPGQSLNNPYTGVLSIFARQIQDGAILDIYEDGDIVRDFVYVSDVVAAFERLALVEQMPQGVVDIGSGEGAAILDVARMLLAAFDRDPDRTRITGQFRPGDIRYGVADIARAAEELGWQPQISLKDGLTRLVDWSRASENKAEATV